MKNTLLEEFIKPIVFCAIILFGGLYILAPATEFLSKWLFLGAGIVSFVVFCFFVAHRLLTGKAFDITTPQHFQAITRAYIVVVLGMFLIRAFFLYQTQNYGGFAFSIMMTILGFVVTIVLIKKSW